MKKQSNNNDKVKLKQETQGRYGMCYYYPNMTFLHLIQTLFMEKFIRCFSLLFLIILLPSCGETEVERIERIGNNLTIKNFDDRTIISLDDSSSVYTAYYLNHTICEVFDYIKYIKLNKIHPSHKDASPINHNYIEIRYTDRNLNVVDKYGNQSKVSLELMRADWLYSDIKRYDCTNSPDIFHTVKNVKMHRMMNKDIYKDCEKKILKGSILWTGICMFIE